MKVSIVTVVPLPKRNYGNMGIIRLDHIWAICGAGMGKLDDDTELNYMGPILGIF